MIYRVLFNGISIYEEPETFRLLSPSVVTELNTAGSFEFTMPPIHSYYDIPTLLTPDVEVYEDDKLIWFGRPVEITTDFWNQKKVYCEGALAYLNDSVQRPQKYTSQNIKDIFRDVIDNHNNQVPANRRFNVGNITVAEKYVNREFNYETTMDVVRTSFLDTDGGYIFIRKEDDGLYIDWLKEMPYLSDQPVQYGLNILDLSQVMSGADIKTAIIPLGDEVNESRVTITSVNDGFDYIETEAAKVYGKIHQVVEFDGITEPSELLEAANEWLAEGQFDNFTIECDAAELHYIDDKYDSFQVGQLVQVTSTPHLINVTLPLVKISLSLNTAVKKITIGTPSKQQLSKLVASSI